MIRLTRRYRFSASHRLHAPSLGERENRELYGKCNNPFGHGHDYVLEVGVSGPVDEESGTAVDLNKLDSLVRREVIDPLDRKDLNREVPAFAAAVPTTENLLAEVRWRLSSRWAGVFPGAWPRLERIGIHETKRNSFECHER